MKRKMIVAGDKPGSFKEVVVDRGPAIFCGVKGPGLKTAGGGKVRPWSPKS